jgi:hypothetical protein
MKGYLGSTSSSRSRQLCPSVWWWLAGRRGPAIPTDSAATVMLATPALPNGKRLCCLLDGSVRSMSEEEYQAAVQHLPPLEKAR